MNETVIRVKGLGRAQALVAGVASFITDPNRVLLPVGVKLQEQVGRTFDLGRDPMTGATWKPTGQLALSTRPGGGQGGKPLRDTQRLLNSLTTSFPQLEGKDITISSNLPYASIHHTGGTIKPVKAKSLSIPLTREARRIGGAGDFFRQNSRKNPFIIPGKKEGVAFVVTKGARGGLDFHYMLVKQVVIPARPYLGSGPQDISELETLLVDLVVLEAKRLMAQGGPDV
jgi:phage gpG-like protein